MTDTRIPAPRRDNLLGVCHAAGEAFGFDPIVLRIVFVVALLADFELTVAAYLAGAIAVVIARMISGAPRISAGRSGSAA